jgi:hypothetical protein
MTERWTKERRRKEEFRKKGEIEGRGKEGIVKSE